MGRRRDSAIATLAAALMLAGCGTATLELPAETSTTTSAAPAATIPSVTFSITVTSSSTSTTTTSSSTSTTTTSSPTTTTTLPVGPWQVEGQRYYFPIQPPEATTYSDAHHTYPATDIFAPVGTTVVAVTDGVVDELRRIDPWDPAVNDGATRGGLYVSIVGDDGVRYYCSHLDSVDETISQGTRVRAGQVIGSVGQSGDAAPTPPHVHFGLSRPTFPGDWEIRRGQVWPYDYLQAWTGGEASTPQLPEA